MKRLAIALLAVMNLVSCGKKQEPYSVRMVRSEMKRNPSALYLDGRQGALQWTDTTGLELLSFLDVAKAYALDDV